MFPSDPFRSGCRHPDIRGFHLVLLAKDFNGYRNLCKLMTRAELEGYFYKPRIDKELLAATFRRTNRDERLVSREKSRLRY